METRYLGSDEALAKQTEAITAATTATVSASDRIGKAVGAGIGAVVESQDNLSKLEMQRQEALARAEKGSAVAQFGQAAVKAVEGYAEWQGKTQLKQQQALLKHEEQQQKLAVQQAKVQSEQQFGQAANELSGLQQQYLQTNWDNGVLNFKSQASKIIAKYPALNPEHVNELIDRANKVAVARSEDVMKINQSEVEKTQNATADSTGTRFLLGITGDVEYLRKLPPTTQAKPFLDQLGGKIESFLKTDNGMTMQQKYEYVGKATDNIRGAYADKAGAYASFDSSMRAIEQWRVGQSKLYADYTTGKIALADYKNGIAQLKISTGKDFSQDVVAPGEQEAQTTALVSNLNTLSKIQQEAQTKAGQNFNLGDDVVNGIAAGVIVNPSLETNILATPLLANNPNVKQAIEVAKRLREAQNDAAQLGVSRAEANKTIAELDLSDAKNVASLTRSIVNKTSANQTLNPREQLTKVLLDQLAQQNPAVAGSLQQLVASSQGQGSFSEADLAQLQQSLKLESGSIANVKKAVADKYAQEFAAHQTKYSDLYQRFGRIPTNAELAEYYKKAAPSVNNRIQQMQDTVNQAGNSAVSPYGQQSNFSTAGGNMAASRQPDGRYTVAPRSALQVQNKSADGGAPFITPVQAGVSAPHSFNKGHMGGGYRAGRDKGREHAGADFPLAAGQKAMTVVSGTVLSISTDSGGYGTYIDYQGDNGYVYRYAHQRPYVKVGQRLNAGEAISTPNGSGAGDSHLHFEVHDGAAYASGGKFGLSSTVDPIAHLRNLTATAGTSVGSNVGRVRGQSTAAVREYLPQAKASNNSIFTPHGGVLQASLFQQVGKPTMLAQQAFTGQRPLSVGSSSSWVAGSPTYNENDDMGYAYLRQNPDVRVAMVRAAQQLGVPAQWISDIVAQETGNFDLATKYHPNTRGENANRNYGLFGFGTDSGVPNYDRLTPVQQVAAYVTYMKENGWDKVRARFGGNVNIAQLWSVTKMGTKWRNRILGGEAITNTNFSDNTGYSYADQLRMLGNHVGREYDVPGGARSGRARRNSAVRKRADTSLGQALAANNSYDLYTRDA